MAFPHDRSIDLAVAEIHRLAKACRDADMSTPVPACPGWTLADLLLHVGRIHRWAATMVEQRSQSRLRREEMTWAEPDAPDGLPDWIDDGAAFVEPRFRAADPDTAMWAWGWPKTAGFWPRRILHETGVHRADAEAALGAAPTFDADIAADGIDELLDNLPHAAYFAPHVAQLRGSGEILALRAPGMAWTITLLDDGFRWERTDGTEVDGDASLTAATPGDLLMTVYRRRQPSTAEITGDTAVVDRWFANSAL